MEELIVQLSENFHLILSYDPVEAFVEQWYSFLSHENKYLFNKSLIEH